jgi:hypothetical protein
MTATLPIGERVTVVSQAGDRRLTGVLLPATARHPRLHDDADQLLELNPDQWLIARAAPATKSRRRTHCPQGRPLYRFDDLPAAQLATESMLRRGRRRLVQGQPPIASYMVFSGKDYAPLYAVADTALAAPLSPARQAARDTARTCARCGRRVAGPFSAPYAKGADGSRYCDPCQEPAAKECWDAQRAADRTAAAEWARGVLQDPTVLLVYSAATRPSSALRVETLDGQVLIGTIVQPDLDRIYWDHRLSGAPDRSQYTEPADLVDQVRGLSGHRLITAWSDLSTLNNVMKLAVPGLDPLQVSDGDDFSDRWDRWHGEHQGGSYRFTLQRIKHQQLPYEPDRIIKTMRDGLAVMAAVTAPVPSGGDR